MFNPWTASYDDVLEAEKSFVGDGISDPSAPVYQWSAAHRIKEYEQQKDKIDGFDVLACIRICLNHDLVAPYWLSIEFIKRYDTVLTCKAKSWDDDIAFGKPYRKGTNINALEKRRKLSLHVYMSVKLIAQNKPIDEALFEEVGKKYNIGKTLASEYYYHEKQKWPLNPPK